MNNPNIQQQQLIPPYKNNNFTINNTNHLQSISNNNLNHGNVLPSSDSIMSSNVSDQYTLLQNSSVPLVSMPGMGQTYLGNMPSIAQGKFKIEIVK